MDLIRAMMLSIVCACAITCACGPEADSGTEPVFTLDSYNGHFVQAISDAYTTFEKEGALPATINVEGIRYTKGQMVLAACLLLEKIEAEPDRWQETEIDLFSAAFGDEYRWNTYDPDEIDMPHVRYMASHMLAYAKQTGSLPNYVTFPSGDPASAGYMPKLKMVVTEHENLMNLRAGMVVLARVFNAFVQNEGKWPEKVSSWPSSYLGKAAGCPVDDPVVLAARDAALKELPSIASQRQKAEAIFTYVRDELEWEDYMNTRKGAVKTLQAKGGNCCDLTHATLAICRAAGIPARYLHGQCYFSSGVIGHVIPEIYADETWWICDPSNNSATFGTPVWKGMETFNGRYYELSF